MADFSDIPSQPEPGHIGFCQHCGRPLTSETVRRVGNAVYCEPCLEARLGAAQAGPGAVPYTPVTGAGSSSSASGAPPPPPFNAPIFPPGSYPNPGLAALLGLIPGVGAMYNEQYAKGVVHLIVFAVLVSLSEHNGIFGLFVAGWIFYMAVEAHHTARARRDGTPLPNPFGLNDIGERLGFGRSWPGGANVAGVAQSVAETVSGAAYRARGPIVTPPPAPGGTPAPEPAWGAPTEAPAQPAPAGYVPPVAPGYMHTPYQPVNYAAGYNYNYDVPPYAVPVPPLAAAEYPAIQRQSRFPAGAAWLIALGVLFLLATTDTFKGLPGESLVGFVLLAFGGWIFTRSYFERPVYVPELADGGPEGQLSQAVFALRSSLMILIAGSLALLDGFHVLPWSKSWPLFLIGGGLLMLLNRVGWQLRARVLARTMGVPSGSGYAAPGSVPAEGFDPTNQRAHFTGQGPQPPGAAEPSHDPFGDQ